jgi:hypothetical protein
MSNMKPLIITPNLWGCLLTILLAAYFTGCQESSVCEDVTASALRAGFYTVSANGQTVSTIVVDSLTIFGVGRPDDKIYDNRKHVLRIELPVNPAIDSTAYVFVFPGHTDTLWVQYRRSPHLISVECGFTMFYDISFVGFTNHYITTSAINTNLVSNTLDEHIQIFIPAPAADI